MPCVSQYVAEVFLVTDSRFLCVPQNNSATEITQSIEDDPLVDGPLISPDALDAAIKSEFHKLPTSWVALLLLFIHVCRFFFYT